MSWVSALKEWNSGKGTWCIPKKGTTEHGEVLAIIARMKGDRAPAPEPARKGPPTHTSKDLLEANHPAAIQRRRPINPPTARKSFAALNQTPAQLADEDRKVEALRKYLAQRKAFSRLKDPIREKLDKDNAEKRRILKVQLDIDQEESAMARAFMKTKTFAGLLAKGLVSPSPHPEHLFDVVTKFPGPEYDAVRKTAFGKKMVAFRQKHPVSDMHAPQYRRNIRKGRDYLGPKIPGVPVRDWHEERHT
jgi:hypothetical protein